MINILQYMGQPPTSKNYPGPNVGSAEVEKPWSRVAPAGEKRGPQSQITPTPEFCSRP